MFATAPACEKARERMLRAPLGSRSSRGAQRWYFARVPEGREQESCDAMRAIVPTTLWNDAFLMQKECWMKRRGIWFLQRKPAYKGLFIVATRDAAALDRALRQLSFPVQLMGTEERAWVPMADEARAWYEAAMDRDHVLRSSRGRIVNGILKVEVGPLVGQENRIVEINRHKRSCLVRVMDADGGFQELMPLEVSQVVSST